ncbi:DUF1559 family PulG-like putative transporter [Pseudobythopirellula maris]
MRSREPERVSRCRVNIRTTAGALLRYASEESHRLRQARTGAIDPSVHSWRTHLLPYLGHESVRSQYRLDEPWNGEANKAARSHLIPEYSCDNDDCRVNSPRALSDATTSYFAVVGPRTAWGVLSSGDTISDDPSRTILLIEQLDRGVAWSNPTDIEFGQALALLTDFQVVPSGRHFSWGKPGFFDKPPPRASPQGFNVAFADGSARFVSVPIPRDLAIAVLTANGGERISDDDFSRLYRAEIDYSKIYAFTFFVLMSLLPALRWFPIRSVAAVGRGVLPSSNRPPQSRDGSQDHASA